MQYLRIATLITSLVISAAALADTIPSALTYEQAQSVLAGLTELDKGTDQIVKDGQQERIVHHAFMLGDGLRQQNGLSEVKLRDAVRVYSAAYNKLVRDYSDGGDKVPPERMSAFNEALKNLLATSSGVSIPHFKIEELRLDKNPDITAGTIALLDPVLDR